MQISSTSTMDQSQMRMRKMDGSGGGIGKGGQGGQGGGMGSIMQGLPSEDQTAIQDQMQSLSQADKTAAVDQIKQLDTSSMNSDEITQSIMDIIDPTNTSTQETSSSVLASLYA